jgi:PhzF family phenazine biosynthesis protein
VRTAIYKLDAFTTRRFSGNPAAVVPLTSFLDDATLQAIAAENNLPETAFVVRWCFTRRAARCSCAGPRPDT